ncbi:hypothetical protein EYR41_005737 [Orbilia oligospora]|uniref:Nucleoside phosphorylase domain-containing protein n=1 Tax=Orbilia oligospora TaxID=2813651 RepID=A0A8H2E3F4_ORBOL|nr:hypothetical protein EYR41_005737 [Orbilia oligospora]
MSENNVSGLGWDIFRNLARYLDGRLQLTRRGQGKPKNRLERKCRVLEVELRHALMLKNFDIGLAEDCEDGPSDQDALRYSERIAQLLEPHVNRNFQTSLSKPATPLHPSCSSSTFRKYPRLYELTDYLESVAGHTNSNFPTGSFNLVLETNESPPIFCVQSASTAQAILESTMQLNACFRQIQTLPGTNPRKRSGSPTAEDEEQSGNHNLGDPDFRKRTGVFINALHQLLPCSDSHKVLLQLQNRKGALDLFLSGCETEQWQEVQCEHHTSRNSICRIDDLCVTLQKCADQRLQIVVEALRDGSHSIHYSPQPARRLYPCASLSGSLEHLLESGSFQNISFSNTSSLMTNRFTLKEKRILALKLGLCFLNFFDARYMTESWRSSGITFLALPEHKIQESQIYINCSLNLQRTQESEWYRPGHPVLTSFARLLLEIDEGQKWPGPSGNSSSDLTTTWVELCNYVENVKIHRGRNFYLEAVTKILYLHTALNEARETSTSENGEDVDMKLRDLMYTSIVSLLELEVPEETRKRIKCEAVTTRPAHQINRNGPFNTKRSKKTSSSFGIQHDTNMDTYSEEALNIRSHKVKQESKWPPTGTRSLNYSLRRDEPQQSLLSQEISKSKSLGLQESRHEFHVAIVCALSLEADAVQTLFDDIYEDGSESHPKRKGDQNIYTTGRISQQDVVLCHLPRMGVSSAASAAANLPVSYPDIKVILVVGVCGAVPFLPKKKEEVILGDVIISDSVVKYDYGRQHPNGFERKGGREEILGPLDPQIQGLLEKLRTKKIRERFQKDTLQFLQILQGKEDEYRYPGAKHDTLFPAAYLHRAYRRSALADCTCFRCTTTSDNVCDVIRQKDCGALGCGGKEIKRMRLAEDVITPSVHIGRIASADTVMKSDKHRDRLAKEEGVIGFEMEGAGVWGKIPCVVIKGVCDYADSHKNKKWQSYASATAAAAAASFLKYWVSNTYREP